MTWDWSKRSAPPWSSRLRRPPLTWTISHPWALFLVYTHSLLLWACRQLEQSCVQNYWLAGTNVNTPPFRVPNPACYKADYYYPLSLASDAEDPVLKINQSSKIIFSQDSTFSCFYRDPHSGWNPVAQLRTLRNLCWRYLLHGELWDSACNRKCFWRLINSGQFATKTGIFGVTVQKDLAQCYNKPLLVSEDSEVGHSQKHWVFQRNILHTLWPPMAKEIQY